MGAFPIYFIMKRVNTVPLTTRMAGSEMSVSRAWKLEAVTYIYQPVIRITKKAKIRTRKSDFSFNIFGLISLVFMLLLLTFTWQTHSPLSYSSSASWTRREQSPDYYCHYYLFILIIINFIVIITIIIITFYLDISSPLVLAGKLTDRQRVALPPALALLVGDPARQGDRPARINLDVTRLFSPFLQKTNWHEKNIDRKDTCISTYNYEVYIL